MPSPALPHDESSRLRKLRDLGILDTPEEDLPDAIVTAAAAIANTPIAAISLIDEDRQWFKGAIGLDVRETTRAVSFCAHAILTPLTPLIVPDARLDGRFSDNEVVVNDPGVRFYAGFPLLVGEHAMGALCVVGDIPGNLTAEQIRKLQLLATGTAAWLEIRSRKVAP
jgi:GAF domain-containing protein